MILLGFGLNLSEIAKVGAQSLPVIVATITTSLVVSFALCKLMRIPSNISTLVGVGSSICGGSAIAVSYTHLVALSTTVRPAEAASVA